MNCTTLLGSRRICSCAWSHTHDLLLTTFQFILDGFVIALFQFTFCSGVLELCSCCISILIRAIWCYICLTMIVLFQFCCRIYFRVFVCNLWMLCWGRSSVRMSFATCFCASQFVLCLLVDFLVAAGCYHSISAVVRGKFAFDALLHVSQWLCYDLLGVKFARILFHLQFFTGILCNLVLEHSHRSSCQICLWTPCWIFSAAFATQFSSSLTFVNTLFQSQLVWNFFWTVVLKNAFLFLLSFSVISAVFRACSCHVSSWRFGAQLQPHLLANLSLNFISTLL